MKAPALPNQVHTIPPDTRKISIIGCGGSGKSTLARQLGEITRLPVIHLDKVFWRPNWQSIGDEAMNARVREIIAQPAWIIDGNYNTTMPNRLEAADLVIFMDFPRLFALFNILKRRITYRDRPRPDMSAGCPEKIDPEFFFWVWNFNHTHRSRYYQALAALNKPAVILKSHRETARFLAQISSQSGSQQ